MHIDGKTCDLSLCSNPLIRGAYMGDFASGPLLLGLHFSLRNFHVKAKKCNFLKSDFIDEPELEPN